MHSISTVLVKSWPIVVIAGGILPLLDAAAGMSHRDGEGHVLPFRERVRGIFERPRRSCQSLLPLLIEQFGFFLQ